LFLSDNNNDSGRDQRMIRRVGRVTADPRFAFEPTCGGMRRRPRRTPAQRLVRGRHGAELRAQHRARGDQVRVEQHQRRDVRQRDDRLDRVDQCPRGRPVARGVGHGKPEVDNRLPVTAGGAVRPDVRRVVGRQQRRDDPRDRRDAAELGERAQPAAQRPAAPAQLGRAPATARREPVPRRVQHGPQPVRVRQQHAALVHAVRADGHQHGRVHERPEVAERQIDADKLRGQQPGGQPQDGQERRAGTSAETAARGRLQ